MSALPSSAYAAALAMLPGANHRRLRAVLHGPTELVDPEEVWRAIVERRLLDLRPDLVETLGREASAIATRWCEVAKTVDPASTWTAMQRDGVGVWLQGDDDYPTALVADPDPPALLFWKGDPSAPTRPTAALIGTRRCTSYGAEVARELGAGLAGAGVAVVSGLALGIDGAAHEGALAGPADGGAPPVAVVGSGLDVIYPARHRKLWQRVGEAGLLLSEAPPGATPEAWRFPRRNRILAALSGVVVVVESHERGGSLSTVRAAVERGIPVMAVPGSVRSPSSAGTNRLLVDGVAPVTDVTDILVALALEGVHVSAAKGAVRTAEPDPPDLGPVECDLLAAIDWTPTATEAVLRRTGLSIVEASTGLVRLEVRGLVRKQGGWWERTGSSQFVPERDYTPPA